MEFQPLLNIWTGQRIQNREEIYNHRHDAKSLEEGYVIIVKGNHSYSRLKWQLKIHLLPHFGLHNFIFFLLQCRYHCPFPVNCVPISDVLSYLFVMFLKDFDSLNWHFGWSLHHYLPVSRNCCQYILLVYWKLNCTKILNEKTKNIWIFVSGMRAIFLFKAA